MNNEWITAQQRKLDEKITAEYRAVTSPQPPDDEWIYELDANAWQAWSRGSRLPRDAGRLQSKPMDKTQGQSGAI
jgi:hypothetical protein